MRTALIILSLIIISVISIPLYLVTFIISKFNPMKSHMFAQKIVSLAFKLWLFIAGTKYEIYGLEKIPRDEAVMYVCNHRSFFDIILSYAYMPGPTSYVSKQSIKKIPCVGQWMYFLSCLFLDRDDIKSGLQMIKDCIALIQKGYSVYIAPEGTRNVEDSLLPFKEGSFKIATRTNCKIVPICYTNTEKIFESHLPWVRRTKNVTMEFGDPVDITGMERDELKTLGVRLNNIIQEMYNERSNL